MNEFREITSEPPNSEETIYGPALPQMKAVMDELADRVAPHRQSAEGRAWDGSH